MINQISKSVLKNYFLILVFKTKKAKQVWHVFVFFFKHFILFRSPKSLSLFISTNSIVASTSTFMSSVTIKYYGCRCTFTNSRSSFSSNLHHAVLLLHDDFNLSYMIFVVVLIYVTHNLYSGSHICRTRPLWMFRSHCTTSVMNLICVMHDLYDNLASLRWFFVFTTLPITLASSWYFDSYENGF